MKKSLIFIHKWLGIVLALLFLMWFVSGLVLYYVPFPGLSQAERVAGAPPLVLDARCCLGAQQAADKAGLSFSEARLGMRDGTPAWRLLTLKPERRWVALDARDGAVLPPLPQAEAMRIAEQFSGRHAVAAAPLERDQWTVGQGYNPHRPLLRVTMDGDDGLELYVAPASGEVVADTRRAERAWNWVGAVPHWIYFTELRRWPDAWHNVVVTLSLPGVLLALSGLALGVWQLFLNRNRWIPYRVLWMRWHHILGLAAGVAALTWIFSGLLSMNPFSVFSPRGATAAERLQWSGKPATPELNVAEALAAASPLAAGELELLSFNGQGWYRLRGKYAGGQAQEQMLVPATADGDAAPRAVPMLPEAGMRQALASLRSADAAAGAPAIAPITAYDELYYARELDANTRYTRPLPAWRAQWPDGVTVYADAASGRILMRADASSRWQRVLYNGLHSLDFGPLMARPWLRDSLVILLSLLGVAMSATACVVGWRALTKNQGIRR